MAAPPVKNMNLYKEYKELYYHELERRNQINSKFIPTITLLTTIVTATIWLASQWVDLVVTHVDVLDWIIVLPLVVIIVLLIYSIYLFYGTYCNCVYYRINPSQIRNFIEQCEACKNINNDNEIEEYKIKGLTEMYIIAACENAKIATKRSANQVKTYNALIITVFFVMLTFAIIMLAKNI